MRVFAPYTAHRATARERLSNDDDWPTPSEVFSDIGLLLAIALGLALAAQIPARVSDPRLASVNGRGSVGWPARPAPGCVSFGRGGAICSAAAGSLSRNAATGDPGDECISFGKGGWRCPAAADPAKELRK